MQAPICTSLEEEELDQETHHWALLKAKVEESSVLTQTFEDKVIRGGASAVEVEKMKSELVEAEMTFGGGRRVGFQVDWQLR